MSDRTLNDLRAESKGKSRKGCDICGEKTAGYFTVHVKEPNESQRGQNKSGEAHQPSRSGETIISRSRSYCEQHLVQMWDQTLELIVEARKNGGTP